MAPGSSLSPLLEQGSGLNDCYWCCVLLLRCECTTLEGFTRVAVASLPLLEEDAENHDAPEA